MTLIVVGGSLKAVVSLADAVEIELFGGPVGGADAVGALEHDVFEIVGYACGVGVFVFAASMDHNAAVDLGLAVFLAEDDLETVVEMVGLDWQVDLGREGQHGKKSRAE